MSATSIDVSRLKTYAFGHRSLVWWGTIGMIAIEGSVFALLIVSYFYLKDLAPDWPPGQVQPPLLTWGTANTFVLLASLVPNQWAKKAAEDLDAGRARRWVTVCLAFALAFNVLRVYEFRALNVWWDQNAYGSLVWCLLGFHTLHIVTDTIDTLVLDVMLFTTPVDECRLVDVSENALYWYFVVLSWVIIYAVVYLVPRLG
jgi:cytochrome c oxidase subunit I+III